MNGARGLVIAALTAFLLGCSSGLIAGILLVRGTGGGRPGWEERRAMRAPRPPEGPMLHALSRRLDLTESQRGRIEAILDHSRERHDVLRDSTRAAIERELTPEQKRGWERMELRLRRGPPGEAPPPPPGDGPEPR